MKIYKGIISIIISALCITILGFCENVASSAELVEDNRKKIYQNRNNDSGIGKCCYNYFFYINNKYIGST